MDKKEITIGRSSSCDISLGESADFASSYHGTIFWSGTQLMFKDMSTNGTIINNRLVHGKTIPINHGDTILIAGKYQINWGQIDGLLSPSYIPFQQTKVINSHNVVSCNKCGTVVDIGTSYCPNCGCSIGNYGNSSGYNHFQQSQQRPFKPDSNMVWAILTTIFCCLPTGIYAIILASKVDGLYYAGRYDEAKEASNGAKKWSFIGCVLAIIGFLLYVIFFILMAAGAAASY